MAALEAATHQARARAPMTLFCLMASRIKPGHDRWGQQLIQIPPLRIGLVHEIDLPISFPSLKAALALDRDNQRADAIALLEKYRHLGTDVVGTLVGRIKRRWLQDGKTEDAEWALSLYETALNINCSLPETPETIDQIFYHAINVAFLKQVAFDQSEQAKSMAQLALAYARKRVPPDVWSVATQAEAFLYLGDYQEGLAKYQEAISLRPETWKLLSTGQQAQQIASRLGRHDLQDKLKTLFDPPPARANKIFVSYSHKDSEWRAQLELVLRPLMTGTDRLDFWADTRIQPGADWLKEISYALATSRVVVLLVSAEFLASDFVRNHELPVVLNAADRGEVILIWLYLSPALYDASPLARYQAAHDISRPLEGLSKVEQRAVLTDIARKIKTAVFM